MTGARRNLLMAKAPNSTNPRFDLRTPRGARLAVAEFRYPLVNANRREFTLSAFLFLPPVAQELALMADGAESLRLGRQSLISDWAVRSPARNPRELSDSLVGPTHGLTGPVALGPRTV